MWNRIFIILATISFALLFASNCFAQSKAKTVKAKSTSTATASHDRYANQEVSYRKRNSHKLVNKQTRQPGKPKAQVVFEPNNEPLWARGKQPQKPKNLKVKARK